VWVDLTPAGIDLTPGYSQTVIPGQNDDNFGVNEIVADPVTPGRLYMLVNYQGLWRSNNHGETWTKISTGGITYLDGGKGWAFDIAPDGTYMLAAVGNNFQGSPNGRMTVMRSTDGGVTWTKSASLGVDPYHISICPFDQTRVLVTNHDDDHVHESLDSGQTFTDMGVVNAAITNSGFIFYLDDADTAIYIGGDTDPSYRGTKSGGTWTWTLVSDLNNAAHIHGASQMFRHAAGVYFHGSAANTGADGIYKSTNNGVNWTRVSTIPSAAIIGTPTTLYSMASAPANTGDWDARFTTAPRNPGDTWAAPSDPTGMVNGAKRMAVTFDGTRRAIHVASWHGGYWRYIE
jgi:hypothetical protein